MKRLFAALCLSLFISASVLAGDIHIPGKDDPPPPPGGGRVAVTAATTTTTADVNQLEIFALDVLAQLLTRF